VPLSCGCERVGGRCARSWIGRDAALAAAIGFAIAALKKQASPRRCITLVWPGHPSLVIKRPARATAADITAVKSLSSALRRCRTPWRVQGGSTGGPTRVHFIPAPSGAASATGGQALSPARWGSLGELVVGTPRRREARRRRGKQDRALTVARSRSEQLVCAKAAMRFCSVSKVRCDAHDRQLVRTRRDGDPPA
jgi:hypothetical protein